MFSVDQQPVKKASVSGGLLHLYGGDVGSRTLERSEAELKSIKKTDRQRRSPYSFQTIVKFLLKNLKISLKYLPVNKSSLIDF